MNFNVHNDVKNRIANIEAPNPTEAAKHAAEATKNKAVEVATGVPAAAYETFEAAFNEALAALSHYGTMTARAYVNGYTNYVAGTSALVEGFRANDPEIAYEATKTALPHFFNGATDFLIADSLAIPLKQAFFAGAKLISGTVTLNAVAELAIPVIFTIAVGYAALKLKDLTTTKMKEMVENALDNVPGIETLDAEELTDDSDVEVVEVEDEDDLDEVLENASALGATDADVAAAVKGAEAGR